MYRHFSGARKRTCGTVEKIKQLITLNKINVVAPSTCVAVGGSAVR